MDYEEFYKTKERFQAATPDVSYPLTYEEWVKLPEKYKASALYVTFYPMIISAARRMTDTTMTASDMISSVNMQLIKYQDMIAADPHKYTTGYIFSLAYNAMRQIVRIDRYHSVFMKDLPFDHCADWTDLDRHETVLKCISQIPDNYDRLKMDIIEKIADKIVEVEMKDKELRIAMHYAMGLRKRLNKKYQHRYAENLSKLRHIFWEFKDAFDIHLDCETFEDVLNNEELVAFAVVEMPDKREGVYWKTKTMLKNGATYCHFDVNGEDIVIPTKMTKELKVTFVQPDD